MPGVNNFKKEEKSWLATHLGDYETERDKGGTKKKNHNLDSFLNILTDKLIATFEGVDTRQSYPGIGKGGDPTERAGLFRKVSH